MVMLCYTEVSERPRVSVCCVLNLSSPLSELPTPLLCLPVATDANCCDQVGGAYALLMKRASTEFWSRG